MKLQNFLLLTGIAAGLMTVSCQVFPSTTEKEAEEFFGRPAPNRAQAEEQEQIDADYYAQVNAHIDRRLQQYNDKEEVKQPVFVSTEAKDEFQQMSFVRTAEQISLLSIDFSGSGDTLLSFVFDRESRTLTRTINGQSETFSFTPFTNGVQPDIPYDAHILYAFATDFSRIADSVTLRCFEKLDKGENPGIAQIENEANIDEKGNKIDKNFVEIKPKVVTEPQEFLIDKRWCQCYDVKLKSICAPAVSMAVFVNNLEQTISRLDITFDDGSTVPYNVDWREQDGIVLPRVIVRQSDKEVFFREDANVILVTDRAEAEAKAAQAAAEAAAQAEAEAAAAEDADEEEMVEIDASEESGDDDSGDFAEDSFGEDFGEFDE